MRCEYLTHRKAPSSQKRLTPHQQNSTSARERESRRFIQCKMFYSVVLIVCHVTGGDITLLLCVYTLKIIRSHLSQFCFSDFWSQCGCAIWHPNGMKQSDKVVGQQHNQFDIYILFGFFFSLFLFTLNIFSRPLRLLCVHANPWIG